MRALDDQVVAAVNAIRDALGDAVVAVYLHGSAVTGGLQPESDFDLFVVIDGALEATTAHRLIERITPLSDRRVRPAAWRPVELTVVSAAELRPWRYPPLMAFQFGEWMRDDLDNGRVDVAARRSPDLAIVATMVRESGRPLLGPPSETLIDEIPRGDIHRAIVDSVDDLLADLDTDTRNVLLTLARMWCTVTTGEIRGKADAADWAIERLGDNTTSALRLARQAYVGQDRDRWTAEALERARRLAELLAGKIRQAATAA